MTTKTKIILILLVDVLIVGAVFYYIFSAPESNLDDQPITATTTDVRVESPNPDTTVTSNPTVPSTTISTSDTSSSTPAPVVAAPVVPKSPVVPPKTTPTPVPPVVVDPAPTTPVVPAGIARSTVATHNSENSCWSVIEGSVYDLTAYVPKHPGGKSEILAICGKDGSSLFAGQHGGQSKPERILAGYYLDVVAK
jgi:hypothetical protein